nr:MAG TPA: hypothetical protein [Caudoviricetes sp.]
MLEPDFCPIFQFTLYSLHTICLILLLRLDYIIILLNKGYFPLRAAWLYSLSR